MRPAVWKPGMPCKFKSLGKKPEHWFEARILRVRDKYAIVQEEKGSPRHVALERLERRTPNFRIPPIDTGPRYA